MYKTLSISAVGDISFMGNNADNPSMDIFSSVKTLLQNSNLVVANLESVLTDEDTQIPDKCCLRGSPGWAKVIKKSGIGLLSLANNHIMDYGETGLNCTIKALDQAGLKYIGAGKNLKQACEPLFLEISNQKVAFLARTSVPVSSPCYASETKPGVAFLDIDETKETIIKCRRKAQKVILLIHWGLEEYFYPSPGQRKIAYDFAKIGVDAIIGSHPHVLQGIEKIGPSFVAYSLGNFLFDDFEWFFSTQCSLPVKTYYCLSHSNRTGMIVNFKWDEEQAPKMNCLNTQITDVGNIIIDKETNNTILISKLCKRLYYPFYKQWWHLYSLKMEWTLRIKPSIALNSIIRKAFKLRAHHLKKIFKILKSSAKIAIGRSEDPYED